MDGKLIQVDNQQLQFAKSGNKKQSSKFTLKNVHSRKVLFRVFNSSTGPQWFSPSIHTDTFLLNSRTKGTKGNQSIFHWSVLGRRKPSFAAGISGVWPRSFGADEWTQSFLDWKKTLS